MGDRCYMEITCRCEDQKRFEALGFVAQDWNQTSPEQVVMTDEQANYAHYGKLPTDIPYHGHNTAGSEYGPGVVACDGRTFAEAQTGHSGGFVIDVNDRTQRPSRRSLKSLRAYLQMRQRVRRALASRNQST